MTWKKKKKKKDRKEEGRIKELERRLERGGI